MRRYNSNVRRPAAFLQGVPGYEDGLHELEAWERDRYLNDQDRLSLSEKRSRARLDSSRFGIARLHPDWQKTDGHIKSIAASFGLDAEKLRQVLAVSQGILWSQREAKHLQRGSRGGKSQARSAKACLIKLISLLRTELKSRICKFALVPTDEFDALIQSIMTKLELWIDAAERADGRAGRRPKRVDVLEAGRPLAQFFQQHEIDCTATQSSRKKRFRVFMFHALRLMDPSVSHSLVHKYTKDWLGN